MTSTISTLGLQLQSITSLQGEQTNLAKLSEQLATGQQHVNLTDYDPTAAHNLMNFQNGVTQKQAYVAAMQTVQTRLTVYDQTMTNMESIASQASSLAASNQSLNPASVAQLQAQIQAYLKELTSDFNQQVGGRYIYAGTRYSTAPAIDLTTLSGTPAFPFVPIQQGDIPTNLPDYDTDAGAAVISNAAWTQDSVTIDTAFSVQYGVTSTNAAFQQLIAGLQFMNAATQTGVSAATYQTDMTNASTLLHTALGNIQSLHAGVANNINILQSQTDARNADISSLQSQLTNLQQVDLTEIGTKINVLQAQLQASYSATATLEQLSILQFL